MTAQPSAVTTSPPGHAKAKRASPLAKRAMRLWARTHARIYRRTRGSLGGVMPGPNKARNPVLLLVTTGRTSGKARTTPLLYLADGKDLVVVASGRGPKGTTDWLLNIRANPMARVQVGERELDVRAATASSGERARLWPDLVAMFSRWGEMQKRSSREVPVVILRPAAGSGVASA